MASTVQASPRGIRLDQLDDFALAIARQVWDQNAGLKLQSDEHELLAWLSSRFPSYVTKPFGERHLRLWDWLESIEPEKRPTPRIEVWPRGGAKSTTGELGIARIGFRGVRKFALYVSGTQEQADLHVAAIADLFEKLGLERALNKYGNSKGWRRNQLRVSNGFNVQALGLDTASRGIKIEEFRPDVIVFDDIDSQDDSPKTVDKKERAIKSAIIPAGSSDCALLFLQNLIHEEGVIARLADDRADFLLDREVPKVSVAVEGLKVEAQDRGDGRKVWKILGGVPTWEGQDLEVCEKQINDWGLKTFLREAQHEVTQADGYFFDHTQFRIVQDLPTNQGYRWAIAFDLAATEGGGDYTAWVLMAIGADKIVYIVDAFNRQIGSDKVRAEVLNRATEFKLSHRAGIVHLPQDPGQAGKDQARQYRDMLKHLDKPSGTIKIEPVSGHKAKRAEGLAAEVNLGNVALLEGDWNHGFIRQYRQFKEDLTHEHDDLVDAGADCFNELAPRPKMAATSRQG
jgi:predicted phage terminase large subunit-like protein